MSISLKAENKEANQNTYNLPRGESIRRAMVTVFRQQRRAILRFIRSGKKDAVGNLPPFFPEWDDFQLGALAMSERFTPLLAAIWESAADKFAFRVGLDPNQWSVINPHTELAIQSAALDFCTETNNTTSMQLNDALQATKDALAEGIIDKGENLEQLTTRVNKIFDKADRKRARRIAQTETSRAVHEAQEQAAIHSRVVTGWRWLASSDACKEICLAIAARCPTVKLGQPFAIVGTNPKYKTIKGPPGHPYCNCALEEILDTDPQPKWHDTLDQPKPATDEEADQVAARLNEQYEEIWQGSNKPWVSRPGRAKPVSKPKPVPPKPKPKPPEPAVEVAPAIPSYGPGEALPPEPEPKPPKKPKPKPKPPAVTKPKPARRPSPAPKKPKPATPEHEKPGGFETHEHVETWAKRLFPNATVSVQAIPVESWNLVSRELEHHLKKYPAIARRLRRFGDDYDWSKQPNALAVSSARDGDMLHFNPAYFDDPSKLDRKLNRGVETGYKPAGLTGMSGASYTTAHEIGHLVDAEIRLSNPSKWVKLYSRFFKPGGHAFDPMAAGTISNYAKTSRAEAFAEAYAADRFQPPEWAGATQKAFSKVLAE